jgi:hypothetical protein
MMLRIERLSRVNLKKIVNIMRSVFNRLWFIMILILVKIRFKVSNDMVLESIQMTFYPAYSELYIVTSLGEDESLYTQIGIVLTHYNGDDIYHSCEYHNGKIYRSSLFTRRSKVREYFKSKRIVLW